MEDTTKVLLGLGVAAISLVGIAVIVSNVVGEKTTAPTRDQEHRLLQTITVAYMAQHVKAYSGTGRTQPDAVMFGKVMKKELAEARETHNLDFKEPRVAFMNGAVVLAGRTGVTYSLTIGPDY